MTAPTVVADSLEARAGLPRELAEVTYHEGYAGLIAAFRVRAQERRIAITSADVAKVAGLADYYVAKLLSVNPVKRIGMISLGPLLGVLGLKLVVTEDLDAVVRFGSQIKQANEACQHTDEVKVILSRRRLRKAGALGGRKSRSNMSRAEASRLARRAAAARALALLPGRRSEIARKAARARWARRGRQPNGAHASAGGTAP